MRFLFIIPVILVLAAPLGAQDFAKGLQAFEAGDFATAIKEWKPLAESGNSAAQNSMGDLYYSGRGVPQNHAEAFRWYRLSAQQGNVDGQGNLGWMFEYGLGVARDFSRAAIRAMAGRKIVWGFCIITDKACRKILAKLFTGISWPQRRGSFTPIKIWAGCTSMASSWTETH